MQVVTRTPSRLNMFTGATTHIRELKPVSTKDLSCNNTCFLIRYFMVDFQMCIGEFPQTQGRLVILYYYYSPVIEVALISHDVIMNVNKKKIYLFWHLYKQVSITWVAVLPNSREDVWTETAGLQVWVAIGPAAVDTTKGPDVEKKTRNNTKSIGSQHCARIHWS